MGQIDIKAVKELAEVATRSDALGEVREIEILAEDDPKLTPKVVFVGYAITDNNYSRITNKYGDGRRTIFIASEIKRESRVAFARDVVRNHLIEVRGLTKLNLARLSSMSRANPELLDQMFAGVDLERAALFPHEIDAESFAAIVDIDYISNFFYGLRNSEKAAEDFLDKKRPKREPVTGPLSSSQDSAE